MQEYRCKYCNKLFFKGDLIRGAIEVKCIKCKTFNQFNGSGTGTVLLARDSSERKEFIHKDEDDPATIS